jgi:transposase
VNRIGSELLSAAARREDRCSEREWRWSRDLRGPLAKQGPRYLRWALVEAATHACTHPIYRERYQQLMARMGKQRGAKVAQVDLARRLAEAIWHMLTRDQPFAPAGATDPVAA